MPPPVPDAPWHRGLFRSRTQSQSKPKAPNVLSPGDSTASQKQDTTARLFTRLVRAADEGQWGGQDMRHALPQLERREPNNPYVKLLRILSNLALGQPRAMRAEIDAVNAELQGSTEANARFYRGLALLGLSRAEDAAAELKVATEIVQTSEPTGHAPAAFYFYWANALVAADCHKEAVDVYVRGLHASRAPAATNDGNELRAYAKVQFHLARALVNERRWEHALKAMREVMDLNPMLGEYHYGYHILPDSGTLENFISLPDERKQQFEDLNRHVTKLRHQIAALEMLTEHDDDDVSAAMELGDLLNQLGDFENSGKQVELAAARVRHLCSGEKGKGDNNPASAVNCLRFGDEAKRLGRPDSAGDFYEAAFNLAWARGERALRSQDCGPVEIMLDVADGLLARGLRDHATKLASTAALLADAAGAQRIDAAAGNLAMQHLAWGDRLAKQGLEKQALAQWQIAATLVSSAARIGLADEFDLTAKSVFDLALQLAKRGAGDSANDVVDVIDSVVGDDILAFADMARAMANAGFADKARNMWPRLLKCQPYHLESWRDYALTLVDAGDVREGTQALNRAISLDESRRPELLATFGEHVVARSNQQS